MAKDKGNTSAADNLQVTIRVICENCKYRYSYSLLASVPAAEMEKERRRGTSKRSLEEHAAMWQYPEASEDGSMRIREVRSAEIASRLQGKACPECGYWQSWMVPRELTRRRSTFLFRLSIVADILTLLIILFTAAWGLWPLAILGLLPAGVATLLLMFQRSLPQGRWDPNRGRRLAEQTNEPLVVYRRGKVGSSAE